MKYFLTIFILAFIFCLPFFINPNFLINSPGDLNETHYPVFLFFKKAIFEYHQFPLWRPTIFSGMPFAADPLSTAFYPGTYLFLLIPINFAFSLFYLIHLFLAGLGTYLLAIKLKVRGHFALFSSIIYMLAPALMAHIGAGHLILVAGIAYFPLTILFTIRVFEKKWHASTVWLSVFLSLMFLVNFLIFFYSSIAIIFLILFQTYVSKNFGKVLRFAPSAILFFGFCAVALLPYLEYAGYSSRAILTIDDVAQPPWNLPKFLSSIIFPYVDLTRYNVEAFLYFGFLPSILAFFGFLKLTKRLKFAVLASALVIVLFALNVSTPFFPLIYKILPFISFLRVTTRVWFILVLMVAILAGFGLSRLTKKNFIVLVVIILTLIEFSFVEFKRVNLDKLFEKPQTKSLIYDFFENDSSTYKIYCTSFCLDQAEIEKIGQRLTIGENPSQLLNYVQYLEKAGGYEFNRHAVIFPPYQVWLGVDNPPQPNSEKLAKLGVKYVLSKYPLVGHNFFEVTKIDDLYVYQNLNFDGFDYVVEPNNIKVTLKSSIDGTLVMPEIYYPGWVAIVDGNQRPIKKIDNLFLAVDLKPKDREVVFKFRPRLFTIGLAITMFTIISSLLFIIRKNYR